MPPETPDMGILSAAQQAAADRNSGSAMVGLIPVRRKWSGHEAPRAANRWTAGPWWYTRARDQDRHPEERVDDTFVLYARPKSVR
jgi:hypothetical protein